MEGRRRRKVEGEIGDCMGEGERGQWRKGCGRRDGRDRERVGKRVGGEFLGEKSERANGGSGERGVDIANGEGKEDEEEFSGKRKGGKGEVMVGKNR